MVSRQPGAVHLNVHVDPGDLLLDHTGDRYHASLSVRCALYRDSVFESAEPAITEDLVLTREQYDSAMKSGIVIPQDVAVKGQIQQVRVMVFDRGLQALGSVTVPVR